MKIKLITTIILLITGQITLAATCSQTNNSIGLLGFDYSNAGDTKVTTIYATLSNHSNQCGCSEVRFKEINTNINVVLDILLAAKTNLKRVRVDLLDAADCNSAQKVYLQ